MFRMMPSARKHQRRSQIGAAMVEFAIVFPVLFLLILGLIDGARLIFAYNTVSNAAREGARFGIVMGDPGWGPGAASKFGSAVGVYGPGDINAIKLVGDVDSFDQNTVIDRIMGYDAGLTSDRTTVTIESGPIRADWPVSINVTVQERFTPAISYALGLDDITLTGTSRMIVE
ncbi:MAG: TadE/TadG family type IV pilus assembly protein [Chloroflexota bacterium]